jgi:hypothetical protein
MKLVLEAPLNSLSFGNVAFNLIRELHKKGVDLRIFPIGEPDLKAYDIDTELAAYIENAVNNRLDFFKPDIPCLKLWHLNGSENRKNKDQYLFTFYECNEPTETEISLSGGQDHVFFSSNYSRDIFLQRGVSNTSFLPLGLDSDFFPTDKRYLEGVTHFGLMGKFENRKHTAKIIRGWVKKYGNNSKYQLSCCVDNPFFKPEQMQQVVHDTLEGKVYSNINFLPRLQKNSEVNDLLNSIDIDLTGLSGGEGWNLPAFNATALGKWSIVLNATSHKDWATPTNSILIEPSGSMPVYDGVFFNQGTPFNNGTFYTWSEEEFIAAMEKAETKVGEINVEGQKLGEELTYSETVDDILATIFGETSTIACN